MAESFRKYIKKAAKNTLLFILVYALFSITVTFAIQSIVFMRYTGDNSDLGCEQVSFNSGHNRLCGYMYSDGETDACVVISPGFHSDAGSYSVQIENLRESGLDVFTYDMTGSNKSEGDSVIGIPQAVLDLDAALDFIESSYDYEKIFLLGHSMGGYAACCMTEYEHDISAVVTISAIDNAMAAYTEPVRNKIGALAYIGYPFLWLHDSMIFGSSLTGLSASECIRNTDIPTLVIHGTKDTQVDFKTSVFGLVSDCENTYLSTELIDAGHTDILFAEDGTENAQLMENIKSFYQKYR